MQPMENNPTNNNDLLKTIYVP